MKWRRDVIHGYGIVIPLPDGNAGLAYLPFGGADRKSALPPDHYVTEIVLRSAGKLQCLGLATGAKHAAQRGQVDPEESDVEGDARGHVSAIPALKLAQVADPLQFDVLDPGG